MPNDTATAEPAPVVLRITGAARPLSLGPILALAAVGYIVSGKRAIGFGIGAAAGVWLQTSGILDTISSGLVAASGASPQGVAPSASGSLYQGGAFPPASGAGGAF